MFVGIDFAYKPYLGISLCKLSWDISGNPFNLQIVLLFYLSTNCSGKCHLTLSIYKLYRNKSPLLLGHWHLGVYIRRQSCWSNWLLILYRSVLWTYCLEFRCKKVKHSGHRMKGYYRTIWATEDRLIMFCSLFCKKKINYFMTKTLNLLPYRG